MITPISEGGSLRGRLTFIGAAFVAATALSVAGSAPVSADTGDVSAAVELPDWSVPDGASADTSAIAAAAEEFEPDDPGSVVDLVAAAAADDSVAVTSVGDDAVVSLASGTVELTQTGATLTDASGRELGFSVAGGTTDIVDGTGYIGDAAPATDIVTRAIDGGVQAVAVLADDTASTSIDFDLTLPEGATLTENPDGSIAIAVETEQFVPDAEDDARLDAEIGEILGDVDDLESVTDEQWAALDALAPVDGDVETVSQTVALIGAPWAVDATGVPLETSYLLDGDTLTQVVTTDASTAFPVIADPSWSFVWQATKCAAQVGLLLLGAVKIAAMAVKFAKYVAGLKKTSKVVTAWNKLRAGGTNADGFKKLASALYSLTKKLIDKGVNAMREYAKTTAALTAALTVITLAGDAIAEIIGIDQCVKLATGDY